MRARRTRSGGCSRKHPCSKLPAAWTTACTAAVGPGPADVWRPAGVAPAPAGSGRRCTRPGRTGSADWPVATSRRSRTPPPAGAPAALIPCSLTTPAVSLSLARARACAHISVLGYRTPLHAIPVAVLGGCLCSAVWPAHSPTPLPVRPQLLGTGRALPARAPRQRERAARGDVRPRGRRGGARRAARPAGGRRGQRGQKGPRKGVTKACV